MMEPVQDRAELSLLAAPIQANVASACWHDQAEEAHPLCCQLESMVLQGTGAAPCLHGIIGIGKYHQDHQIQLSTHHHHAH